MANADASVPTGTTQNEAEEVMEWEVVQEAAAGTPSPTTESPPTGSTPERVQPATEGIADDDGGAPAGNTVLPQQMSTMASPAAPNPAGL